MNRHFLGKLLMPLLYLKNIKEKQFKNIHLVFLCNKTAWVSVHNSEKLYDLKRANSGTSQLSSNLKQTLLSDSKKNWPRTLQTTSILFVCLFRNYQIQYYFLQVCSFFSDDILIQVDGNKCWTLPCTKFVLLIFLFVI